MILGTILLTAAAVAGDPTRDTSKFDWYGDFLLMVSGGPYNRTNTATRVEIRGLAEAGVRIAEWHYAVDKATLDLCEEYGVKSLINGQIPPWYGGDGSRAGKMREQRPLSQYDAALAKHVIHPNEIGFYVADEPSALDMPYAREVAEYVVRKYPGMFPQICLYPSYAMPVKGKEAVSQLGTKNYREYLAAYCREIPYGYLSFDCYPWAWRVTRRQFNDNIAMAADAATGSGRRLIAILQLSTYIEKWDDGSVHRNREMDASSLRYQAFTAMAYGAEGICWACWKSGFFDDKELRLFDADGKPLPLYADFKTVNAEILAIAAKSVKYRRLVTEREGPFLVGRFLAKDGSGKKALFVFKADDPENERPGEEATYTVKETGKTVTLRSNQAAWVEE